MNGPAIGAVKTIARRRAAFNIILNAHAMSAAAVDVVASHA